MIKVKLQSLRWQLAVRFALATMATMLIILTGLSAFLFSRILIANWQVSPENWVAIAERTALPTTRRILENSPENGPLIELWMTIVGSPVSNHRLLKIGEVEIIMRLVRPSSAMLVDADGQILGYSPREEMDQPLLNPHFREQNPMNNSETIEYIMSGGRAPASMINRFSDNESFTITLPVESETEPGKLLGILSVRFEEPYSSRDVAAYTAKTMVITVIALLILTAVIALLFAFFTAKELTNRLQRFAYMAEKWSRGDYSLLIDDERTDEIGLLAKRFDMMATQTAALLRKQKETAIESERHRMAMELHDSVKQQALAASMQLGTAMQLLNQKTDDKNAAAIHLTKTENLLDTIRSELNAIVNNKIDKIDDADITTIINTMLDNWSEQNEIDLTKRIELRADISYDIRQALYRIMQEALSNLSRHSGADKAEVVCCSENDFINLKIQDNGIGFFVQYTGNGNGLRSMKDRCESIGGTFNVESKGGQGTLIEAVFYIGDKNEQ